MILLLVAVITVNANIDDDEYNKFTDFFKFIEKYGSEALKFLECMGEDFVKHCSGPVTHCLSQHDAIDCISAIICEGKDAQDCMHVFK